MPDEIEAWPEEKQITSEVEVKQSHFTTPHHEGAGQAPPKWREKLKLHKFKIFGGVFGVLVITGAILGAYKLAQRQAQPAPRPSPTQFPQITPSPREKGEIEIGAGDDGGQIMLEKGQTLVLSLKSNPTTGYRWEIMEISKDVLRQTYYKYKPDQPTLIGSGGQEIRHFRAETEGRTTLALKYWRPWEEKEPIQTFRVEVVVRVEEGVGADCQVLGTLTMEELANISEADCQNCGGRWELLSMDLNMTGCNLKTSDAGKACTDETQCIGACEAKETTSTSGTCSEYKFILGCNLEFFEGKLVELCRD